MTPEQTQSLRLFPLFPSLFRLVWMDVKYITAKLTKSRKRSQKRTKKKKKKNELEKTNKHVIQRIERPAATGSHSRPPPPRATGSFADRPCPAPCCCS
ncbi:hypothetical protein STCU_09984 [Strigomonas culicis]|uniref:Uncharacterized protein n=1 Tax=Strigomonas culicis TaxID=28005 RepID=S9TJT2_9TRYP|nr:hypothetical protein STCU_09984 [Strigomonas culicis]|eukprot:EPY18402.1 hypothetical protein STCU_09984 [Strigomonas culicis]